MRKSSVQFLLCFLICLWSARLPAQNIKAAGAEPPAVVPAPPPVASLPAGEHWRLIYPGRVEKIDGVWERPAPLPAELAAIWYWSERVAPIRLLPKELANFSPRAATEHFLHRRPPPVAATSENGRNQAPAVLIAGPVEIWREVPEDLLPHWPWPAAAAELLLPRSGGSQWQARLLDEKKGSFWIAPARAAKASSLPLLPAQDRQIQVVNAGGEPVQNLGVDILRAKTTEPARWPLAIFQEGKSGRVVVPSLPDAEPIVAILKAPGYVPLTWQGLPSALPERFRLESGVVVGGRLVDSDGRGVGGEVRLEAWLPGDFPSYLLRGARSAADGTFTLQAVPTGSARLTVESPGFASMSRDLEVDPLGLDLGDLVLIQGGRVELAILSEEGEPIPGAQVSRSGRPGTAAADEQGRLTIEGADAEQALALDVKARDFLPKQVKIFPPFLPLNEIRLSAAFVVEGLFLDEDGQPVKSGHLIAGDGRRSLQRPFGAANGAFEVSLPVDFPFELRLFAASGSEARVALEQGRAGERRQLGAVRAVPSRRIAGRLVSARSLEPVAGGRVFLPRPGHVDEASALLFDDVLEAISSADGHFELRGVPAGGALLRIDSPAFARKILRLPSGDLESRVDLGDILLGSGAELEVVAPFARDGVAARLDLGGRRLELDMLTSSIYDGKALFRQVPGGKALLTLVDRGKLLCEKEVTIPAEGHAEVDCLRARVTLSGEVTLGGRNAGPGHLTFSSPVEGSTQIIRRQATPGGLHNDRLEGVGRPPVEVAVGTDGRFVTDELMPGVWRVGWVSPQRSFGGELAIEIVDDSDGGVLALDFPALELRGQVVDLSGRGVVGARVRETRRGLLAFSGEHGEFSMVGLEAGQSWLVAEKDGERSPGVAAIVEPDGRAEDVVLTLGEESREGRVEVEVQLPDESPAAAALVFLETSDGIRKMISANQGGRAIFELDRPFPSHLRVGAFADGRLGLGELRPFDEAIEQIGLRLQETGSLRLHSAVAGRPLLENDEGWDVSWWLGRLGRLPIVEKDQELEIGSLPAGSYRVGLAGRTFEVAVQAGQVARLEAP